VDRVAVFDSLVDSAWLSTGDRDAEPELVVAATDREGRVAATADGRYAIELAWPAAANDAAVDYYSIYASAQAPGEIGNATLVGSTRQTRFRDTGLRPATTLEYRVVGYDTRGRPVVSYSGQGRSATGPKPVVLRLSVAKAVIDGGLERGEHEGRPLVRAASSAGPAGRGGKATFTANVPQAADYAIWFYARSRRPGVSTSAALDQTASTMIINGYVDPALLGGLDAQKAAPWLVQRLVLRPRTSTTPGPARDLFPLSAGQHTISLGTGPAGAKGVSDEFGDVIITNDLTWTPGDYNPRRLFDLKN